MFSDLSTSSNRSTIGYPALDKNLPFSDYIALCRTMIEDRRKDLHLAGINPKCVIDANSPFELPPMKTHSQRKIGALLIHGLFDCPFSLRNIGSELQANGVLCRAVLLPGHGTHPNDMLHVSYHDWIETVRYGVESFSQEVDEIMLVGYSMGSALSIHHALQDSRITRLILLAPAIKVSAPVDIVVGWHRLLSLVSKKKKWIYIEDEIDYSKYQSIAFNPITQIAHLLKDMHANLAKQTLNCPIFMVISREDETVSSLAALDFFSAHQNPESKILLYTGIDHRYPDPRIMTRLSAMPHLHIRHFSHRAILFNPDNEHYGKNGDYAYASHTKREKFIYGAYNHLEVSAFDFLYNLGITSNRRRELTYNPDFSFMSTQISQFI